MLSWGDWIFMGVFIIWTMGTFGAGKIAGACEVTKEMVEREREINNKLFGRDP